MRNKTLQLRAYVSVHIALASPLAVSLIASLLRQDLAEKLAHLSDADIEDELTAALAEYRELTTPRARA